MKRFNRFILALLMTICLSSCVTTGCLSQDVTHYSTYADEYISSSNGILIVYHNDIPYYQYYNSYNNLWYRIIVPYTERCYIVRNPHRGRHFMNYDYYRHNYKPNFHGSNRRPPHNPNIRPGNHGSHRPRHSRMPDSKPNVSKPQSRPGDRTTGRTPSRNNNRRGSGGRR